MHTPRSPEAIAASRRAYEAFQQAGLDFTSKPFPGPAPKPPAPLYPARVIHEEVIPGGWCWSTNLRQGEALRIAQQQPGTTVALVAWSAADVSERLCLVDTAKLQWTTALSTGRALFSDMGRVMLSFLADSSGQHDCLTGGSNAAANAARYGTAGLRNTRDNLVLMALKRGLDRRDIPGVLNLFAPVRVDDAGVLAWRSAATEAPDFVELRAEMDVVVGLSNCPHPLDPKPEYAPAPVAVTRFRAPEPRADDLARTATAEAMRGFENNAFASA